MGMDNKSNENLHKEITLLTEQIESLKKEIKNYQITDKPETYFEAMLNLSIMLNHASSLREIGIFLARETKKNLQYDAFAFMIYEESKKLIYDIYEEDTPEGKNTPEEVPVEEKIISSGEIIESIKGNAKLINHEPDEIKQEDDPQGLKKRHTSSIIYVPIIYCDKVQGIVSVQSYTYKKYSEKDIIILQAFANLCGSTLFRIRTEDEKKTLHRLSHRLSESSAIKEIGKIVAEESRTVFSHDAFILDIYDETKKTIKTIYCEDTPLDSSAPQEIPDVPDRYYEPYSKCVLVNRDPDFSMKNILSFGFQERLSRSLMFAPIKINDRIIGMLSVQSYTSYKYKDRDLHLLQFFADQCGSALLRENIKEDKLLKTNHIEALQKAARFCADADNPQILACNILNILSGVMSVESFAFIDYQPSTNCLIEILKADTIDGEFTVWKCNIPHPMENNPMAEILKDGKPKIELRNPRKEIVSDLAPTGDKIKHSASLLFSPIIYKNEIKGIISVQSYKDFEYNHNHLDILSDISNLVGLALAKINAEKSLKKNEDIYKKAIEYINGVPYQLDYATQKYTYIGEGIYNIIGYTPENLDQHLINGLVIDVVLKGETEGLKLTNAIDKFKKGEIKKWQSEVRLRNKKGDLKWISDISLPILDEYNKVIGAFGIIQDITEHKRIEENLLKRTRIESTAALAAGIAHDFNNLMVGIMGNAEFLKNKFSENPEYAILLENILKSAEKSSDLAQQLLAYARGGKYNPEIMNINDSVKEMVLLKKGFKEGNIQFLCDLKPDLWNIKADKSQIDQVIMNLLLNSVESIENIGMVKIKTENILVDDKLLPLLSWLRKGRYIVISVEDNGCGMAPEVLGKIFEPFYSTKMKGRGLGLSAVYGIVKNHGGQINVSSRLNEGTIFEVYLPALEDDINIELKNLKSDKKSYKETILVIDDEPVVLNILEKILFKIGYNVFLASNGSDAIHLIKSYPEKIDLVILDMEMPGLNGKETFFMIKNIRPEIKFIICSGYDLDSRSQEIINAGAFCFVQKPFRAEMISKKIREALDS